MGKARTGKQGLRPNFTVEINDLVGFRDKALSRAHRLEVEGGGPQTQDYKETMFLAGEFDDEIMELLEEISQKLYDALDNDNEAEFIRICVDHSIEYDQNTVADVFLMSRMGMPMLFLGKDADPSKIYYTKKDNRQPVLVFADMGMMGDPDSGTIFLRYTLYQPDSDQPEVDFREVNYTYKPNHITRNIITHFDTMAKQYGNDLNIPRPVFDNWYNTATIALDDLEAHIKDKPTNRSFVGFSDSSIAKARSFIEEKRSYRNRRDNTMAR